MTLRTPIRRLAAAALAAALVATPLAAAERALRIGWTTSDGPADPYAIAAREFAAALEALAPGAFDAQFFPNRQLGDEKEMLEGLSFGTLDAAIITNAVIANVDPAFQLNDMPFLYASERQAHQVLDGEIGRELLSRLEAKGVVGLGFAEGGFRHMINNVRPVGAPEDVAGVKYRVMQNPVFIGMFSSLGGNAVPMAWGETYTAVQQGAIDGLEIPIAVIHSSKFAEVARYLSLTRHTYSAIALLMSKRYFDRLEPALQDAVREAAGVAIAAQREAVAANVATLIEELKAAGMQVNEIDDPAAFRARVADVYAEFRPQIGAELFDRALAAVE